MSTLDTGSAHIYLLSHHLLYLTQSQTRTQHDVPSAECSFLFSSRCLTSPYSIFRVASNVVPINNVSKGIRLFDKRAWKRKEEEKKTARGSEGVRRWENCRMFAAGQNTKWNVNDKSMDWYFFSFDYSLLIFAFFEHQFLRLARNTHLLPSHFGCSIILDIIVSNSHRIV